MLCFAPRSLFLCYPFPIVLNVNPVKKHCLAVSIFRWFLCVTVAPDGYGYCVSGNAGLAVCAVPRSFRELRRSFPWSCRILRKTDEPERSHSAISGSQLAVTLVVALTRLVLIIPSASCQISPQYLSLATPSNLVGIHRPIKGRPSAIVVGKAGYNNPSQIQKET